MSYGRLLIHKYLPNELIKDTDSLDFDEFYRLVALADISRKMSIDDMETGVHRGCLSAFGEETK